MQSFSVKDQMKQTYQSQEELICGICLNEIFIQGVLNQCEHLFCYNCIIKWSKQQTSCPTCRRFFSFVTRVFWLGEDVKIKDDPLYVPYMCQGAQIIRLTTRVLQESGFTMDTYRRATTNPHFHEAMAQWGYPVLDIISDSEELQSSYDWWDDASISEFSESQEIL